MIVARSLTADSQHGPLPALLLTLTVVTGLVDAVSILALGRVFVANMTGNVVFVGFALAGAPGFSLAASLSALGGFLIGAFAGGRLAARHGPDRRALLLATLLVELVLIGAGATIAQSTAHLDGSVRDAIAAVTAVAMGVQNASVRKMAVPDLTTTVLTMTLTGLAADMRGGNRAALLRRGLAVTAMLGGAVVGALLVDKARPAVPLEVATGLLAAAGLWTCVRTKAGAPWAAAGGAPGSRRR